MTYWNNLKLAYQQSSAYLISGVAALLLTILMFSFTDYQLIVGNMGQLHANLEITLQVLTAILFGININLLWTKLRIASITKTEGGTTTTGAILGVIISGCPACSITIASYLGLASIIAALPFSGLEVKIAGLLILIYSSIIILKNLSTCKPQAI